MGSSSYPPQGQDAQQPRPPSTYLAEGQDSPTVRPPSQGNLGGPYPNPPGQSAHGTASAASAPQAAYSSQTLTPPPAPLPQASSGPASPAGPAGPPNPPITGSPYGSLGAQGVPGTTYGTSYPQKAYSTPPPPPPLAGPAGPPNTGDGNQYTNPVAYSWQATGYTASPPHPTAQTGQPNIANTGASYGNPIGQGTPGSAYTTLPLPGNAYTTPPNLPLAAQTSQSNSPNAGASYGNPFGQGTPGSAYTNSPPLTIYSTPPPAPPLAAQTNQPNTTNTGDSYGNPVGQGTPGNVYSTSAPPTTYSSVPQPPPPPQNTGNLYGNLVGQSPLGNNYPASPQPATYPSPTPATNVLNLGVQSGILQVPPPPPPPPPAPQAAQIYYPPPTSYQPYPPPPSQANQQASVPFTSPLPGNSQPTPGVNPSPELNEDPTQAYHTQNTSIFSSLDDLIQHLQRIPGSGYTSGGPGPLPGDKSVPIVLLPGFLGWGTPLLHVYNYFGGLVNLGARLAERGWPVIVPIIGAVSSNWERACELYAQLSYGSFDGQTFDIVVDYGSPPPDSGVVYVDPPPKRRQATAFNLDPSWRWGPQRPVHFIAHSQGGNTVRYLIHLLENGESAGNSSYFREKKLGWVKSLVTLAAPFNGTTMISVLEEMGDPDDVLLDNVIAASCWEKPENRVFDFLLDHRGIGTPAVGTPEAQDLLAYLKNVKAADGALTKWKKSKFNGLYDNSIDGVVGGLNKIIGPPSKDVYCFTLSFAATVAVPPMRILKEDVSGLGKLGENFERLTGLFSKFGFGSSSSAAAQETTITTATTTTTTTTNTAFPPPPSAHQPHSTSSGGGSWASYIPSKRAKKIVGNILGPSSSSSSAKPQESPPDPGVSASPPQTISESHENRAIIAHHTFSSLFNSLQDLAKWSITRINTRLPRSVPKIPLPGSTTPRADMFPPFVLVSFGMGAYELSLEQRAAIAAANGPTKDSEWHEHDGVVNTVSMRGPWGYGNRIARVEEVIGKPSATTGHQGVAVRREDIRGVWVDLGKCSYMDHADCIGTSINPLTVLEVVKLYRRLSDLLELL